MKSSTKSGVYPWRWSPQTEIRKYCEGLTRTKLYSAKIDWATIGSRLKAIEQDNIMGDEGDSDCSRNVLRTQSRYLRWRGTLVFNSRSEETERPKSRCGPQIFGCKPGLLCEIHEKHGSMELYLTAPRRCLSKAVPAPQAFQQMTAKAHPFTIARGGWTVDFGGWAGTPKIGQDLRVYVQ